MASPASVSVARGLVSLVILLAGIWIAMQRNAGPAVANRRGAERAANLSTQEPKVSQIPWEVSCQEVQGMQARGEDFVLLDCRLPDEYAIAKLPGSILLPLQELAERAAELEPHRQRRIVVHCHHGARSLKAAQWLRQQGFPSAQSMAGGIDAWSQQVDPAVPRY